VFGDVVHPGIGLLRTPASPLKFPTEPPVAPAPAPLLGMHTDEVLADVLDLSTSEIGALHDDGVVASDVAVG
jgi:2-methylfumaryl-CoA isomerase